jgi:3-methyladenine DNA glycosylase AlkD
MISDPTTMSQDSPDAWVESIGYYGLADVIVQQVAGNSPHRDALMARWIESPREYVAQAGWDLLGQIAMNDTVKSDTFFVPYIERIERDIHSERNRVRHAMNGALVGIAMRSEELRVHAVAASRRIGKVVVDHGETGCKTPNAEEYIAKALEYKARKRG